MLFNSIDFAIFLPVVFLVYWFVVNRNLKAQNFFLITASYLFYGWWDWRFLFLVAFSTIMDYTFGISLKRQTNPAKRKSIIVASLILNLGFLSFFKYFNFFADNFVAAFTFFGASFDPVTLNVVLPVGISFYTFQSLSYTIDVYRRKLEPTEDFVAFAAFVSFFPQLVAGPIERATNLLPQFYKKRVFDYTKATDGSRQMLWGFFKKIVIADNCALYVNQIFNHSDDYAASTLVLGAILFAFQIYCDFSGYSDIAIGVARLFGFGLMRNFAFPYFSRNIAEFWRRWHISLSTWFRDYVYLPLGGSKGSTWLRIRNTFIVFILSGFWHGANWTFIAWGALNALLFLPLLLSNNNRNYLDTPAQGRYLPSLRELGSMVVTFGFTVIAWVFFRAENIQHALSYLKKMFSPQVFNVSVEDLKTISNGADIVYLIVMIVAFVVVEWIQRNKMHGLEFRSDSYKVLRRLAYYTIGFLIFWFQGAQQQFIYFQF